MNQVNNDQIRQNVRIRYEGLALQDNTSTLYQVKVWGIRPKN